jgi:hypothetical protein
MLEIWQQCTGREIAFRHGFSEATIICGARSGKDSWIVTPTAAFEARSRLINPHTGEKRFEILGKLSQIFTGKSLRI